MYDEIDELLADWYDWQQSYRPKLGYGRADPACRDYRSRGTDSDDLADIADARSRKVICEAVDACVSRLTLPARIAIQTEMRNRFVGTKVWGSVRQERMEYSEAKELLRPILEARDLIQPLVNHRKKA
ncbi:hypothetical protein [Burkholderia ambifaria]|uniref:hypothetical protein n=1 Tax=Burkholderia ambifaria TaxID=152480 RepID=UPI001588D953|nr:hypothetical protein [Burkholderia ambifaria]